jgi:hypothetical protein
MGSQGQVRPRVYRRIMDGIALLWVKRYLSEDQQKNFVVTVQKGDSFVPVKLTSSSERGIKVPERDAEMVFIPHDINGLSPNNDYYFKVLFGSQGAHQIEARLDVYATSVLPPDERDDSRRNQHMYGFVGKKRKWFKVPLVEHNGQLAIPVVVLNASELKDTREKRLVLPSPQPPLPVTTSGNGSKE